MSMNDKELQKIQDELMKNIDEDVRLENHILESSEAIASNLLLNPKITVEVNNTQYRFAYKLLDTGKGRFVYLLAANLFKAQVAGKQYTPFTITSEVDESYSLKDNLKTAVEGFIRHITGKVKPETTNNNDGVYQVGRRE